MLPGYQPKAVVRLSTVMPAASVAAIQSDAATSSMRTAGRDSNEPPGSACSIGLGTGLAAYDEVPPGSVKALHLVVDDIERARAELVERGVEVGPVQDVGGGVRYAGLADPDGNTLTLQEMSWRTGDRF